MAIFVLGFACVGVALILITLASPNKLPEKPSSVPINDIIEVERANSQLTAISRAVRQDKARSSNARTLLTSFAEKRKEAMLRLFTANPDLVDKLLLPEETLAELQPFADGLVERKVELSGTYAYNHRHLPDDTVEDTHQLITADTTYTLYSNGQIPAIASDSKVKLTGYQLDKSIFVLASDSSSTAKIEVTSSTLGANTLGATTLGPIKAVVIFADFADSTTSLDINGVRNAFEGNPGGDVKSFFAEASYNKSTLEPSFFGPYRLSGNAPSGNCGLLPNSELMNLANTDVDYTQYRRFIFVYNCRTYGATTGLGEFQFSTPDGTITGAPIWVGTPDYTDPRVYAHELSHNLGNYHANFFVCLPQVFVPPSRFDENCQSAEYGNEFDILGGAPNVGLMPHHNAHHKNNAGWFSAANYPTVSNSPGSYTYTLAPYESPSTGTQAIRIPRGNSGTAFTVEYRQPLGFDAWMDSSNQAACKGQCKVTQGAMINLMHSTSGSGGGGDTQAIDTTPGSILSSQYYPKQDNRDGVLLPGRTFTDSEYGISVETLSADTNGLTVRVNVPVASCNRVAPTVTLTSAANQVATSPDPKTYNFSVKNNDSNGCQANKFKIRPGQTTAYNATGASADFREVAAPDDFTLAPGATTNVSLTLLPPGTITHGTYSFLNPPVTLQSNVLDIAPVQLPSITYQLSAQTDTVAPTTPSSLTGQAIGSSLVQLNWAASTDNNAVIGYEIIRDDSSLFISSTPNFNDYNPGDSGLHNYSIRAFDRRRNFSPAANVSINVPVKAESETPKAPGNLTTNITDRSVTLNWNPGPDNVGVRWFSILGINNNPVVPAGTNSITFDNLPTNKTYDLRLIAYDADGNASDYYGSELTVTTGQLGTQPPSRPNNFRPSSITNGAINLSWDVSTDDNGVSGYHVYKNNRLYATVTTNNFTDTALLPGTGYEYFVKAFDAQANVSSPSPGMWAISARSTSDTTPPSNVALINPSNGANVSAITELTATANDNISISDVQFMIDDKLVSTDSTSPYKFSWDTTATYNGSHRIFVKAKDSSGNLTSSSLVIVNSNNGPADTTAPTVVITTPTANSTVQGNLTINGTASDNAALNKVEVAVDGASFNLANGLNNWTHQIDTSQLSNGQHTVTAKATDNSNNESTASVTVNVQNDTIPPAPPANVTATATAHNQVNISWTASPDSDLAGYYVTRSTNDGPYNTIQQVGKVVSYNDNAVTASNKYDYQLLAFDAAGNVSAPSAVATTTTPAEPDTQAPAQPASLNANTVSSSQINLTWTASSDNVGVSGYDIYRSIGSNPAAKITTVTATSYGDGSLSASTAYNYYVIARDAAGNSSLPSSTAQATTLASTPPTNTGVLSGTVSSSSGGPISGATVALTAKGFKRTAITNSSGAYTIASTPPGTYTAKYSASLYQAKSFNVIIQAGLTTSQNVILQKR